jgi:hypothetical protein
MPGGGVLFGVLLHVHAIVSVLCPRSIPTMRSFVAWVPGRTLQLLLASTYLGKGVPVLGGVDFFVVVD